jgi:hypothetical protein
MGPTSQGRRKPTGSGWQCRGGGRASAQVCSDDTGGLRWSPMIGDAPCRSEGEREVSEGRGWERRGSEGSAPWKGRRAVAPAKSRRLMGPRCSGELQGGWPGKATCGSGGSDMDERGRGETGMGRWPAFVLNKKMTWWRGLRERKSGGRRGRIRVEAGE